MPENTNLLVFFDALLGKKAKRPLGQPSDNLLHPRCLYALACACVPALTSCWIVKVLNKAMEAPELTPAIRFRRQESVYMGMGKRGGLYSERMKGRSRLGQEGRSDLASTTMPRPSTSTRLEGHTCPSTWIQITEMKRLPVAIDCWRPFDGWRCWLATRAGKNNHQIMWHIPSPQLLNNSSNTTSARPSSQLRYTLRMFQGRSLALLRPTAPPSIIKSHTIGSRSHHWVLGINNWVADMRGHVKT